MVLPRHHRSPKPPATSAPQRVKLDYFEALSEISQEKDLPFDIHVLETKLQRVLGEEKYQKSLVRYVHDLGFLKEQVMIIHSIWVDDEDIELSPELLMLDLLLLELDRELLLL